MNYLKMRLLSIDAWRMEPYCWTWNQWYILEDDIYFLESELTPRKIFKALRKWGYLSDYSKGRVSMFDDGYNLVIENKNTKEPIFALEYGHYLEA